MSFKKKSKMDIGDVPDYANTAYKTGGLFGTSTSTKKGVSYNPTNTISNVGKTAWKGLYSNLKDLQSGDFSQNKNYQVYSNNLQRQMRDMYNNDVLNPISNNGLMRSSGLQASTNAFNDTLANQTADLYDRFYQRQQNTLSNYQNILNDLYKYISGGNTNAMNASNYVNNFNQQNYEDKKGIVDGEKSSNNANWGQVASSIASLAAAAMMNS